MLSRSSNQERSAPTRRIALLTLACALLSLVSVAATTVVFGPQTYRRRTGPPVTETKTFRVAHPAPQYTLRVTNHGVTSGEITLNGRLIINEDQGEVVPIIERAVTLRDGDNEIRVRLEGKPDTSWTVEIFTTAVDTTPPTITATASPGPNANGWNNSDVTVTFTCSDADSGVESCPSPVVVSAEGASQAVSGTAVDKAGNSATTTISLNIDKTPPAVTATRSPEANGNGWSNSPVVVTFAATDALSGVAPGSLTAPVTFSTDGVDFSASGQAVDRAGNVATASLSGINIDQSAPSVVATVTSSPNANGWYNAAVTVHFTCADTGSGIGSCPADQIVSSEGAQTVSGTATDKAGNTATASTGPIQIDFTPPAITASLSPAPNGNGWNNSPVTVHFTCADGGAGVAACPADQVVSTDGLNQVIEGLATDNAGNSASASAAVNIDRAPPVLTFSDPADNFRSFTPQVNAVGAVFDSLSGVAGVTCNGAPATVTSAQVGCSVTLTPGANSLVAIATDAAGNTTTTSLALEYRRIPVVTITTPANLSYFNITPTTVTGTVDDDTATVTINSIPAVVTGGAFTLALPLAEGPNVITATATTDSGGVGTTSVETTLDTTPPHVTITSPADQFVTTDESISIAGNINDIVVGTVNDTQAQVTVNGATAQVANRLFLASNIPLTLGPNVIQAVGRDRVGNAATTQITVTRTAPQAAPQIRLVSGNNQLAAIGSALAQPLVVALTDVLGSPAANARVIFKVTQNDGVVAADGGTVGATAIATTGPDGRAHVSWTLGHRAGAGGNVVEAYLVGFEGTAVFTATGTQGTAAKIVVDTGNDQIGAINAPLPKPFIAVVVDDGNNRLGGVPVTFTVVDGGGSFEGQNTFTVETDSDGRAAATLTLGLQEGNANNTVEATFPSNASFPAGFSASGRAPGEPQKTTITGVVLDNSNAPIPGVTVRAVLTNELHSNAAVVQSAVISQTDAQGQFDIPGAPIGLVKLLVDGSTAQRPGVFPALEYDIVTIAGQNNTVGQPIYLLPLNTDNQLCVTATTGGGTLTVPEAPGFSLTFGPGQVTFPGGSKEGCVSVTVVHGDKVPMVPGFGQQPRFIVTIQPAGAVFNPPAPITLPNVDGLRPREVTEMYSFDHDIGSFVAVGTGMVSDDGLVIRSSQGVGVLKAGWHCGGNPSSTGTAANCPQCQKCQGTTCVPDNGASCDDGKFCTSGDGKNPGPDTCDGGSCQGKKIEGDTLFKVEVAPDKILKIKNVIEEVSDMTTTATAWMPCWVGKISPEFSLSEEKGKFCCEEDKKMLDGNRLSGGAGGKLSAGCFIGLTSLAPELPPKIIQAVGLEAKASVGVKVTVSDVLNACTGPQWEEKGDLSFSLSVNAVFVKVGDIVGAKLEGPKGEAKVGFEGENLFSNFHFTGSACIDGEVKLVVEHFGVGFEVKLFSLFNKICWP